MIVGVPAHKAKIAEDLVDFAKGTSPYGLVETRKDWEVVKVLFAYWANEWQDQYIDFQHDIDIYREAYKENKHGVKEDKGGASLQHIIEMPETFYYLFHKFFPAQNLDRKFIRTLIEILPDFRMHSGSKI